MKRRSKIAGMASVGLLFAFGLAWFALLGRTRTVTVAENVRVLITTGLLGPIGANVTIVTHAEGMLVVDAQLAPLGNRIQRAIDRLDGGPIRYLVNTHWHPDHTGGNEVLKIEGEIVAHSSVRRRRSQIQEGFGLTKPGSHHVFAPLPESALPTRSADQDLTLTVGNIDIEIRHFAQAHTDGDLAVYVRSQGVVVVGDLVWPGSFPFIDTPTGGTAAGMADALNALVAWIAPGTRVIPGHGEIMAYEELLAYRDFVLAAIEAAASSPTGEPSLAEAQEAGLPQEFRRWESPLVPSSEWIRMVQGRAPGA